MWAICRLFLLVSVCKVFLLAGCVPIQPEFAGYRHAGAYHHAHTGTDGHTYTRTNAHGRACSLR